MKKVDFKKYLFKRNREHNSHCEKRCSCGWGIYSLGFIGAAIYYISNANSFGEGVLGLLKAIVWPAFLVYKLLGF